MLIHEAATDMCIRQKVTHNMQIPLSYADAVIGAAGASISYIRRHSGATVTIQESRGAPGEMTVEIIGSASQVQTAQQLVQVYFLACYSVPYLYLYCPMFCFCMLHFIVFFPFFISANSII
jgi:hypothetical protein